MKPTPIAPDYPAFLTEVKVRIQTARLQAGRAVNRELVMLYWDIGRGIVEKQQVAGWGEAVVECLASDLRAEFPDMRGFSNPNVWRMVQLYSDYSAPGFLSQAVRELKRMAGKPFLERSVQEMGDGAILEQPVPEILSQAVRELVAAVPWGHHANVPSRIIRGRASHPPPSSTTSGAPGRFHPARLMITALDSSVLWAIVNREPGHERQVLVEKRGNHRVTPPILLNGRTNVIPQPFKNLDWIPLRHEGHSLKQTIQNIQDFLINFQRWQGFGDQVRHP